MWTSERGRTVPVRETEAEFGVVTLGGGPAAVLLGGERRQLPIYSPGGLSWRPAFNDQVLVLKAGAEQESPCVLGKEQQEAGLAPGEMQLTGGTGILRLSESGLELIGPILVNGMDLDAYIRAVAGLSSGEGG